MYISSVKVNFSIWENMFFFFQASNKQIHLFVRLRKIVPLCFLSGNKSDKASLMTCLLELFQFFMRSTKDSHGVDANIIRTCLCSHIWTVAVELAEETSLSDVVLGFVALTLTSAGFRILFPELCLISCRRTSETSIPLWKCHSAETPPKLTGKQLHGIRDESRKRKSSRIREWNLHILSAASVSFCI